MKRLLKYKGKEATVTNFTLDSTDEYGDPSFTESTVDTRVVVNRQPSNISPAVQNMSGQESKVEAEIYLDSEVTVEDGEGDTYPSEITVDGKAYQVQMVDEQGLGITRTLCARV